MHSRRAVAVALIMAIVASGLIFGCGEKEVSPPVVEPNQSFTRTSIEVPREVFGEGESLAGSGLAWGGSNLYLVRDSGVWRYDPKTGAWTDTGIFSAHPDDNYMYDITSMCWAGSFLYVGTFAGGVWQYNPQTNTWIDIGGPSRFDSDLHNNYIGDFAWDGSNLYAASNQAGLWRYNTQNTTWKRIGTYDDLQSTTIDPGNLAWDGLNLIVEEGNGIWQYNPGGNSWTHTNTGTIQGLAIVGSDLYTTLYEGKEVQVVILDPRDGSWTDIDVPIPAELRGGPGYGVGGEGPYLYVMVDGEDRTSLLQYNPSDGSWTDLSRSLGITADSWGPYGIAWDGSGIYVTTQSGLFYGRVQQ